MAAANRRGRSFHVALEPLIRASSGRAVHKSLNLYNYACIDESKMSRSMKRATLALWILAACLAGQGTFTRIPGGASPTGVSADGSIVVG